MLFSVATIRQKLSTYAITILTHQRYSHFQRTANAELFIATLFRYRDQGKFQLHGFVVMPDHVHVLITPAIDQSTSRCIQLIKGGYSFATSANSRPARSGTPATTNTASEMRRTSKRRSSTSQTIRDPQASSSDYSTCP
jgi:REP element-mobilizing transposase RayT